MDTSTTQNKNTVLPMYQYSKSNWPNFPTGNAMEWCMTNGLGSYSGMSLIGAQSRTHQGYLIASLHSPTRRFLVFEKTSEKMQFLSHSNPAVSEKSFNLHTSQYRLNGKHHYAQGQQYLTSFTYDGTVTYVYDTDQFHLKKEIGLVRDENTCVISYEITNHSDQMATFTVTPYFNFREHSTNTTVTDLRFNTSVDSNNAFLTLVHQDHPDYLTTFSFSEGKLVKRDTIYEENVELQIEVDLETEGLDAHYCPYDLELSIPPRSKKVLSILVNVQPLPSDCIPMASTYVSLIEKPDSHTASKMLHKIRSYYESLITQAKQTAPFVKKLVLAADHFLCKRASTGYQTVLAGLPWFTDWGRDTMIAFTGLTLCTRRFKEAKEILLTFSQYVKNGIVPNMFPDDDTPPLYNTADASLLYFYAVERFLHYCPAEESYAFILENIYPTLEEIIHAYEHGTDNAIYMEEDGLIHAGSDLDQITWMDVRVGDWVPTPRHGKPVEINAYWYNALRVMEMLCEHFKLSASHYQKLADKVKVSFIREFWNEKLHCLYDVVDGDLKDATIRPNQIYAVSMPYGMLSHEQEKQIVDLVKRELYVGVGIRSLAPSDPQYHGIYCGSLPKRDAAYHQGTAWGFIIGGFISAYCKVYGHTDECKKEARLLLEPVVSHMENRGCVGSISEIFDGDAPHTPRGCYAQAWSVGEVLRTYVEDVL